MIDERWVAAIEGSDTDELIRVVDGLCEIREWDTLIELRRRCDEAVTRGKQLWGVSEFIRYRLALDAPGRWAGPVVSEGESRFTLGPLTEVAASTKTWGELDPHLAPGPHRAMVAHERVVRGETLLDADVDPHVLELPLDLEPWEPAYEIPRYRSDRLEVGTPPAPSVGEAAGLSAGPAVDDPDGPRSLLALVDHWVDDSNGRAEAVCVEGDAGAAVGALGVSRAGLARIDPATALAWMAWAAADGGAHGRRRGTALGRFSAWWTAHELAGLDWPVGPADLGAAVHDLAWFRWDEGAPETGWVLKLAVESAGEGLSWAVSAVDRE